jgi:hypothetical protein
MLVSRSRPCPGVRLPTDPPGADRARPVPCGGNVAGLLFVCGVPAVGSEQLTGGSLMEEWRWKILPECRGKAEEAVAQLRALGLRVELRRGNSLVFELEDHPIDRRVVEILDRVWPRWRDCFTE